MEVTKILPIANSIYLTTVMRHISIGKLDGNKFFERFLLLPSPSMRNQNKKNVICFAQLEDIHSQTFHI